VCSIFFDLKKAFDSIPHRLLLQNHRLEEIAIDPYNIVQRIHSYLTCRLQVVIVGGEQSSSLPVIAGVPQGSVLGPLLFLIFINEIASHISADSKISLFADDIALYRSILSDADYSILQSDISTIVAGINSSLLSLQPAKCCYNIMLISRKKNKLLPPCVTVEGTPLAFVSSMRSTWGWSSIPIYLDPPMWPICVSKPGGSLVFFTDDSVDMLTQPLSSSSISCSFAPIWEYCSIVWNPYLVGDIESLEKVQRFALWVCLKNLSCEFLQRGNHVLGFTTCYILSWKINTMNLNNVM
jgi:hypothetical protein